MKILAFLLCLAAAAPAAEWRDLLAGNLDHWEILGDGVWTLRSDGVLVAHRLPSEKLLFDGRSAVTERDMHQWRIIQS